MSTMSNKGYLALTASHSRGAAEFQLATDLPAWHAYAVRLLVLVIVQQPR